MPSTNQTRQSANKPARELVTIDGLTIDKSTLVVTRGLFETWIIKGGPHRGADLEQVYVAGSKQEAEILCSEITTVYDARIIITPAGVIQVDHKKKAEVAK
jgi:hypothetical protein